MGLLKSVVKLVTDPSPVSRVEDLEDGRVAADGVVRVGEDGELLSPVKSRPCVAFYYRAFAIAGSTRGGYVPRKLREVEVYHPFDLEMAGGRVKAVPAKSAAFSAEDHRILSGQGHENFRATEDLISPGTRVRLWGKLRSDDAGRVIRYTKIEVLAQAPTGEPSSQKKRRKKKQAPRVKDKKRPG